MSISKETLSEERLESALALGDEGDWGTMGEHLRELLEEYPDHATILCWLGVAERELGMDGVAYERFKAAVAAQPADAHVLAIAGGGLARFDDPEAESVLRTATLMDPKLTYARTLYGGYLAREGLVEEALTELDTALSLAPEDPDVLTERGVALALAGRVEEAVDAFYGACSADPEDGWARALVGLALLSLGRIEDAFGDLLSSADLRPDDVEITLLAALVAAVCEDPDRAYELIERARLEAIAGDLAIVEAVLERVDDGREASKEFLIEELVSSAFRERLMTRL